jgi:MoaA/NifB/PqqE/SkfB family radical SAM enzyme
MHPTAAHYFRRAHSAISYRLRGVAGGRLASLCRPVSIGLLISERCNARCVHCDIWKNRGQEDSPTVEEWRSLLLEISRWLGPVHVVLSGGEALLRPWTPELVACGSSLGLYIEVLTHGYWMEQSRIEQMALARPGRVTVSVDGIGALHSLVRGREKFWDYTLATLNNLSRLREERDLGYNIRLKTVIMDQNIDGVAEVANFAAAREMEVFYQPIEQNYNTAEDPAWFTHSPTWPGDTENAVRRVEELIGLKRRGSPIANSFAQLEAMIPYFRDPDSMRVRVQSHAGHERKPLCGALTTIQVQSNGDVTTCCSRPPVGNIRQHSIREIWNSRPRWWESGCCMERRFSEAEKQTTLIAIRP